MDLKDVVKLIRNQGVVSKQPDSDSAVELQINLTASNYEEIREILERYPDSNEIETNRDIGSLAYTKDADEHICVKLAPSTRQTRFYKTWDEFLLKDCISYSMDEYFILEANYFHTHDEPNEISNKVSTISQFWKMLNDLAEGEKTIKKIFIYGTKLFSLNFCLNLKDITSISSEAIANITKLYEEHSVDEKANILKNCISELLSENKEMNFNELLKMLSKLKENYLASYQMYLENFSYKKIKTELVREHIEISKKIQDIADSIWNKIIALPIGYAIALNQFDTQDIICKKNLLLLLGLTLTNILIHHILTNAQKSLSSIDYPVRMFLSRYSKINEIESIYSGLTSRIMEYSNYFYIYKVGIWISYLIFILIGFHKYFCKTIIMCLINT